MDTLNRKQAFSYTYSAKQQEEIKNIRSKYMPPEEDKMEQLRRLDRSVGQKGSAASIAAGVSGTLLLGIGMCCCMVWGGWLFLPGIVLGAAGIALICCAYPLYNHVTKLERRKIAPQILSLSDELLR